MPRIKIELKLHDEVSAEVEEESIALMGSATARVALEGEIPEYGQVWLWDRYYAQALFEMGEGAIEALALRECLELWAVNMSSKVFQPRDHIRRKGHLTVHEGLAWGDDANANERLPVHLALEVEGQTGELPALVETTSPASPRERFWAVVALTQFFIDENDLFARELPIHVLALRKFHADIAAPHLPTARDDAPFYAIQKALEYFQKANQGTVQ